MKGTPARRRRIVATFLLFWRVLGWDLSTHKAQLSKQVTWIGFGIKVTDSSVSVYVKEDFMKGFRTLLNLQVALDVC